MWTKADTVDVFDDFAYGALTHRSRPMSRQERSNEPNEALRVRSEATLRISEKLIVSHYENSYGGAVKRLNQIQEQVEGLDFGSAPGFVVNV